MHNSFIYLKLSINFTSNCRRRFLFFNLQCSSLIFSWIFTLKLLANNMNVVRSKFFALMAIFLCLFPPRSSHLSNFPSCWCFAGYLFLLFLSSSCIVVYFFYFILYDGVFFASNIYVLLLFFFSPSSFLLLSYTDSVFYSFIVDKIYVENTRIRKLSTIWLSLVQAEVTVMTRRVSHEVKCDWFSFVLAFIPFYLQIFLHFFFCSLCKWNCSLFEWFLLKFFFSGKLSMNTCY